MALTPFSVQCHCVFYVNHNDLKISRLTRMIEKYAFFAKKKLKFLPQNFAELKNVRNFALAIGKHRWQSKHWCGSSAG